MLETFPLVASLANVAIFSGPMYAAIKIHGHGVLEEDKFHPHTSKAALQLVAIQVAAPPAREQELRQGSRHSPLEPTRRAALWCHRVEVPFTG